MIPALANPGLTGQIILTIALAAVIPACGGGSSSAPTALPAPTATSTPEPTPVGLIPPVTEVPAVPAPIVTPPTTPATPVTPVLTNPVIPVTPVVTPPVVTPPVVTPPVVPAPSSSPVTAANSCSLPSFQIEVMRAINAARAVAKSCGTQANPAVASLAWNDTLFAASASHSQDMAVRNYFSHTSPEGTTSAQRAVVAGYNYRALGENIAAGQRSIETVMQGWIASEGHCRNIMNSTFTEVAVACVATDRPLYPTYWTMVLGKPQ